MTANPAPVERTARIAPGPAPGPAAADHAGLLAAVAGGDREAFVALFDHYAPRIKSYFMKGGMNEAQADDLAQESLLAVWQKAKYFDPGKAAPSTWIFTVARNKRVDAIRRSASRPETGLDSLPPSMGEDDSPSPADTFMRTQETEILARALDSLPPEQAELIREAFFAGKTHMEIAAEKNLPIGTVKSRIRLALDKLKKEKGVSALWN